MGKKHQKHPSSPPVVNPDAIENEAAAEMQAGRFRKARDLYKTLCKQNRDKYLPGLIEANRLLAVQLMEKGQLPEAQQVIAYLKTIAPASELLLLELEGALAANDWAGGFECALGLLSRSGSRPEGQPANLIADALVLSFADREASARLPEPFQSELNVIHEALQGISEMRYEQVQEMIRPLARGSIFASWKMLVKALLAFYGGDAPKAKVLFNQLPAGGLIERAGRTFGLFLGVPHPTLMPAACQLLRVPELAAPLCRADEAWQKQRFIDSYKELRVVPGFPSLQPNLAGALSDFYMKACALLPTPFFWPYISYFDRLSLQKGFKNDDESWLVYRMLLLEMEKDPGDAPLDVLCREFIKRIPAGDPLKNKIASMVLARSGAYFAKEEAFFGFGAYESDLRDADKAIELLEESITLDPTNLSAHLKLLDVYDVEDLRSERNRLLDKMTALFPRSKAVMLRAGSECVARKTWGKGLDYLQRARDLDTLDPEPPRKLVDALTKMARQYYEKGTLAKGRHGFERAYQYALPSETDFDRGSVFVKTKQAMLELVYGDEAIGKKLRDEALAESGSVPALSLFEWIYYRSLNRKLRQRSVFIEPLDKAPRPVNAFERRSLCLMLDYAAACVGEYALYSELNYVSKCLQPVVGKEFTQEEALDLIPLLSGRPEFSPIVKTLINTGLKHDPKHPRFRFYKLSNETHGRFDHRQIELNAIRDEAVKRGDSATIKLVASVLDSFRHERGQHELPDWNEPEAPPSGEDIARMIPPEIIADMLKKVSAMNDAEFEDFRRQTLEMMPAEFFEVLFGQMNRQRKGRGAARR